jgi:hypothetical protein
MSSLTFGRLATRLAVLTALTGLGITGFTASAYADTSAATAQAVNLSLAGGSLVNSGTESASNAGGAPTDSEGSSPALSVLGTQSTLTAGVLVQQAVAYGDGSSAACAGLVGNGGTIQVGSNGTCVVTGAAAGGVTLELGPSVSVQAEAILEECSDSSTGTPTASAQLVDAHIVVLGTDNTLPVNPTAGSTASTAGLVNVSLNAQTPTAGEIKATALEINLIGSTVGVDIGTVSCGPDAVTAATSAFPLKSLPIAGGVLLAGVAVATPWYRRRRPAARRV